MERRFVCLNFEKGSIAAYVSIAGNRPLRVMRLDGGSEAEMRAMAFEPAQLDEFRRVPTTFGADPSAPQAA